MSDTPTPDPAKPSEGRELLESLKRIRDGIRSAAHDVAELNGLSELAITEWAGGIARGLDALDNALDIHIRALAARAPAAPLGLAVVEGALVAQSEAGAKLLDAYFASRCAPAAAQGAGRPAAATFVFVSEEEKAEILGQLSDGWGENYVALKPLDGEARRFEIRCAGEGEELLLHHRRVRAKYPEGDRRRPLGGAQRWLGAFFFSTSTAY